jgi:NADPH:quinone reductase-like Zn-dependent oxidoreductase
VRGLITDPAAPGGLRLTDDLPEPSPRPYECVIELRAFSINYGETILIKQRPDGWRPGQDISGVVIWPAADGSGPPEGTRVAAYLEWEGGAVLGRNVLVTSATGGVGQFATQLAVAAGANVTAQVSRPEREPEARELGAHQVITTLDDPALGPFHLVLDGIGGPLLTQAVHRMAPGATLAAYGRADGRPAEISVSDFYRQAWNARIVGFISPVPEETKGEDLAILAALVANGRLTPRIGLVLGWEQTAAAFTALTGRNLRGKAVLTT